jgi:CO/xanthine dehydrogenase Mo-binding subunit
VAADDCGVALNHMLVEGQVHGGIVQGGVEKLDIPFTPSRVWEALATKA